MEGITSQPSQSAARFQQLDACLTESLAEIEVFYSCRELSDSSHNQDLRETRLIEGFKDKNLFIKRVNRVSNQVWLKLLFYTFLWLLPRITVFTAVLQLADKSAPCNAEGHKPGCFYFRWRARDHERSTLGTSCPVIVALVENGKGIKIPTESAVDILLPGAGKLFYDPGRPDCQEWVEGFNQNIGVPVPLNKRNVSSIQRLCTNPHVQAGIDKSEIELRLTWAQLGRAATWMFVFLFADAILHFIHDLLLILGFAERLAAKCGLTSVVCNGCYVAALTLWAQSSSETFVAEARAMNSLCFYNVPSLSMFATVGAVFTLFVKFLSRFGTLLDEEYFGSPLYMIRHRVPWRIVKANMAHDNQMSDVTSSLILPKGFFAGDVARSSKQEAYLDSELLVKAFQRYDIESTSQIYLPDFVKNSFKEPCCYTGMLRCFQTIAISAIIILLVPFGLTTISGLFTEFWAWSVVGILVVTGNIIRFGFCQLLLFHLNIMSSGFFCMWYVVKHWIEDGIHASIQFERYPEGPVFFPLFIGLVVAASFSLSLLPIFVRAADMMIEYIPGTFLGNNQDIEDNPLYLEVVYMNLQFSCYIMCVAYFKQVLVDFKARLMRGY